MDVAHLSNMVEQIARNFAIQGDEAAAAATAEHIRLFWDPRMKAAIKGADRVALSPIAAAAVERIG
jgi:formate dehydrogenase subunit delta